MTRLSSIGISGFRRLKDVKLEMRPLMVMIGANGVGKTSLLDAMSLLSASAAGNLNKTLSVLGGINSILTRGVADELSLSVEMTVPNLPTPFDYELSIAPQGNGYVISHEELSDGYGDQTAPFKFLTGDHGSIRYFAANRLAPPNWEVEVAETALSQVPKLYRQPDDFRRVLSAVSYYHVLDVGPRAPVRLPQPMKPAISPGGNGEDLVSFLYSLRETDQDRFESIVDSMRAGFPTFESLSFPPVAAGTLAMTWKDRDFRTPLYMSELSEGTLRFLWLVSLLQSPSPSTITMIDEPEVSLHPQLLSLLVELMQEASRRTQLIVATHSDRLIRFLKPEEVVVLDQNEEGLATATWADSFDIEDWLEEYSLDDVWRMGCIGGRP
jgi:predicted ATPase